MEGPHTIPDRAALLRARFVNSWTVVPAPHSTHESDNRWYVFAKVMLGEDRFPMISPDSVFGVGYDLPQIFGATGQRGNERGSASLEKE